MEDRKKMMEIVAKIEALNLENNFLSRTFFDIGSMLTEIKSNSKRIDNRVVEIAQLQNEATKYRDLIKRLTNEQQ